MPRLGAGDRMRRWLVWIGAAVVLAWGSTASAGPLLQATITLAFGTLPPHSFTSSGGLSGSASGTGAGAAWSVGAGDVPSGITTTVSGLSARSASTHVRSSSSTPRARPPARRPPASAGTASGSASAASAAIVT